jgi:hypothetical protein
VARSGGSFYTRAKKGFFEIPKPISTLGIGVDNIPEKVRNSHILSGNDLGMLGNVEALPSQNEIDLFIKDVSENHPNITTLSISEKHKLAKNYLSFGDINSAWKLLLS